MLIIAQVEGKIHWSIQNQRYSPLTSTLASRIYSLSLASFANPRAYAVCCTHIAHDLRESPDEAKWKWVQQSYDWGRRNHPHCNHSHTKTLCHKLAVHISRLFSGKGRSRVTFQPQKPTSSSHTLFGLVLPDALCAQTSSQTPRNCAVFF